VVLRILTTNSAATINNTMFFVISFPKSGRTWLGVMLDDLRIRARYSHDSSDHRLRLPLSELRADKAQYAGATVLLMVRDPATR